MSRRLLIAGPVFHGAQDGGLHIALNDLARELQRFGWEVESAVEESAANGHPASPAPFTHALHSPLARLKRWPLVSALWRCLPVVLRRCISFAAMPRELFEDASATLRSLEERLTRDAQYDAVLLCVDGSMPGTAACVMHRHPRVLVLSLGGLAEELGAAWWPVARRIARFRLGGEMHPLLFRRIAPEQVVRAVFASEAWRLNAVQAGLDPLRSETVYFGIPVGPIAPRPPVTRGRILWIGRLIPAKGLHHLLEALPELRRHLPEFSVTAIAGPGPQAYREELEALVNRLGLGKHVEIRSGVERQALQAIYAEHDVLFFHSENPEPVALTLLEAFAAGIPVVATQPQTPSDTLNHNLTCLLCPPHAPQQLADALRALLDDPARAKALRTAARDHVEQHYSSQRMGERFNGLLDALLHTQDGQRV